MRKCWTKILKFNKKHTAKIMKIFCIFLLAAFSSHAGTNLVLTNWTFTNLQGRVYSDTTLRTATPAGIAVAWEPFHYEYIDFTNLPNDVRRMFDYDAAKSAAYKVTAAAKKEEQQEAARLAAELGRIKKLVRRDLMEVVQVLPDGILANLV
jgi:hypothetical protein